MTKTQRSGLIALSILIAMAAMGLWLSNFDVSAADVSRLGARLRWGPILPLFILLAGHVGLSAWRWSLIEVALGGRRPDFMSAFATGAFALGLGTFLPAPIVNVACRGLANRVNGASGMRGVLSGAIDQLADLAMVVLLTLPAAIALLYGNVEIYFWGGPAILLFVFGLIRFSPNLLGNYILPFRIPKGDQLGRLANRRLVTTLYGISFLRVVNLTLMTLLVHAAVGTGSAAVVIVSIPLVTLAISAAMLPGAIGVSEWSFSAVFAAFGVASGDIVLFVLANRIVLTALYLLLALIILALFTLVRRRSVERPSLGAMSNEMDDPEHRESR